MCGSKHYRFGREAWRRGGLLLAVMLLASPLAAAQKQYGFADQALLEDTMRGLVARITNALEKNPLASSDACNFHLVSDRHASRPFDEATQDQINAVLIEAVAEITHVTHCNFATHELTAGQPLPVLLTRLRDRGEEGLAFVVSYYPTIDGVMTFAKLQNTKGSFVAASGRYDLPVEATSVAADVPARVETPTVESVVPAAGPRSVLRLAGSSVIGEHLAPELAEGFLRHLANPDNPEAVEVEASSTDAAVIEVRLVAHPEAPLQAIEIDSGGDSAGMETLFEGGAEIAMEAERPEPHMVEAFGKAFGVDMHAPSAEHVIGIDVIEVVVHPDNNLSLISRETAGEVFTNGLNAWNKVPLHQSGLDGQIVAFGLDDDMASGSILNQTVLHGRKFKGDRHLTSESELAMAISAEPMAIGMVSKDFRGENRPLAVNECGILYEPDSESLHVEDFEVNTGDHPLARPIYLYTNPAVEHALRDQFLAYVASVEPGQGQEVVGRHFVNLDVHLASTDVSDWRYHTVGEQPAQLLDHRDRFRAEIRNARRLSPTFRFRRDSFGLALDSRGEQDLQRLVAYLQGERIAPERLLLFGFADSEGSAEHNALLAESRAEIVAHRLSEEGFEVPSGNYFGVGEDAPIACNDLPGGEADRLGRHKNRRVEIWLRS